LACSIQARDHGDPDAASTALELAGLAKVSSPIVTLTWENVIDPNAFCGVAASRFHATKRKDS
jgi:hypothetical protein